MYTIFINKVPIYLTDGKNHQSKNIINYDSGISIRSIIDKLKSTNCKEYYVYSTDLKGLWNLFRDHFKIEKAAGGLIKNNNNETLFIFRLNKWDLPKGKIEIGETKKKAAIREVKEECGLKEVEIVKKLAKTYHIFERNGKEILKITYWYLMSTNDKHKLIPQLEEDITHVVFKNEEDTKIALKNTYGNIKLLFQILDK